jgi:hypothetical protein
MAMTTSTASTISIRLARDGDRRSLTDLAALASVRALRGPVLLALVDGEPWAALALEGGAVIADPFRRTADVVALLQARAAHLAAPRPAPRSRFLRRLAARQAA